jgi:hypothetical protein
MVAAVVGVVGAGVSLYNGMQSADAADKAGKRQQSAIDAQTKLGQDQLQWSKDRYNEWDSQFQPILSDIKAEAYKNMQPDYATVGADVNNAYNAQQGAAQRNMERYGVKPTDGATTAMNTSFGLGRAAALVSGDQNERHRVQNQKLSNLEGVYGLGTPMLTGSMGAVGQSGQQLSGAYGNAANMYGNQAATYGAAAGAGVSGALGTLGNLAGNMGGGGSSWGSPSITPDAVPTYSTPGFDVNNLTGGYRPPPVTIG